MTKITTEAEYIKACTEYDQLSNDLVAYAECKGCKYIKEECTYEDAQCEEFRREANNTE